MCPVVSIFKQMDLNKLGGLGHSLGARSIYSASLESKSHVVAAVTLDMGSTKGMMNNKAPKIPFMFMVASNTPMLESQMYGQSSTFELNKNNFKVLMTPNINDINYSKHNTFQDIATLQYHPASKFDFDINHVQAIQWYGMADGYVFTRETNDYLLQFFDSYLKGKPSDIFFSCKNSSSNSLIYYQDKIH